MTILRSQNGENPDPQQRQNDSASLQDIYISCDIYNMLEMELARNICTSKFMFLNSSRTTRSEICEFRGFGHISRQVYRSILGEFRDPKAVRYPLKRRIPVKEPTLLPRFLGIGTIVQVLAQNIHHRPEIRLNLHRRIRKTARHTLDPL